MSTTRAAGLPAHVQGLPRPSTYNSADEKVEGKFMFLHGTKERMGATETEQMVLDEAVGNNQLLSGWRGEPNVTVQRDGSTIATSSDGCITTVRSDGSTLIETPNEHAMFIMPSGREDLLRSCSPYCATVNLPADTKEMLPNLSTNSTGDMYL